MFLLVSKFKKIGMLLNFVHSQVKKSYRKHIAKESNGFPNYSTLTSYGLFYQNNQVFSVNCPVFWQLCCKIDITFHISQTSKFGQQLLAMMNYPWDFSQSD